MNNVVEDSRNYFLEKIEKLIREESQENDKIYKKVMIDREGLCNNAKNLDFYADYVKNSLYEDTSAVPIFLNDTNQLFGAGEEYIKA